MNKVRAVLEAARSTALTAESWADLSNALFDPVAGLIANAFPTRQEREWFVKTGEYRTILELIDSARQRTGLVEGAAPSQIRWRE